MANPTGKGGFKPGQSGNPAGRPRKNKALTEILDRAGSKTIEYDDKRISSKRLMTRLAWQGVTTGQIRFPDGRTLQLSLQDWLDFVQWIFNRVDGPPPKPIEITGMEGGPVVIQYTGNADPNDL